MTTQDNEDVVIQNEVDNNENPQQENAAPEQISRIEDITPLTREALYGRLLDSYCKGELGDAEEEITATFARYFGSDFRWEDLPHDVSDRRLQEIAEDVLNRELDDIKLLSISLTDTNINEAITNAFDIVGINVDLSQVTIPDCKAMFEQRAGDITELWDTYAVLEYGRRLFDLYTNSSVSPEINADVLRMEDFYREGVINREVLAWYYYNVAMVYEKYSMQKNSAQAVYKEHYRSISFMNKALDKTDKDISLLMNIRDALIDEPKYNSSKILDACHRVIDNSSDNHSLYLAHKLYADTLADNERIHGFSNQSSVECNKIIEHYRTALKYTSTLDDKLDILNSISVQQKRNFDNAGYITTQIEISDALSGRKRIRSLKNLEKSVQELQLKAVILKSAINEFLDLDEVRQEDLYIYASLDSKLRELAKDDSKTIAKLDKIKKKYNLNNNEDKNFYIQQTSSKGRDYFTDGR